MYVYMCVHKHTHGLWRMVEEDTRCQPLACTCIRMRVHHPTHTHTHEPIYAHTNREAFPMSLLKYPFLYKPTKSTAFAAPCHG